MPTVRFFAIQAPPKKMRDTVFGNSVVVLADYYATTIATFQPSGPFSLGGWSAGAVIALEAAQNLRGRGRDVRLLVAFDGAPENTDAGWQPWHPFYLLHLLINVPIWIIHKDWRKRSRQPVWRRAETGGAVARFIDVSRLTPEHQKFVIRLYDALGAYTPVRYPGAVVVYEASVTPLLRWPQVSTVWRHIAHATTVVRFRGNHLSILNHYHAAILANDLQARIASAD
jgi:thioesterase domain-containing protein